MLHFFSNSLLRPFATCQYNPMTATATTYQVWMSYAQFEAKTEMETARSVFRRGYDHLRRQGLKEERWVCRSGVVRRANLFPSRCFCLLLLFAGVV